MFFRKSNSGSFKTRGNKDRKSAGRRRSWFGRRHTIAMEPLEERTLLAVFSNPTAIAIPAAGDEGPAAPYPSNIVVPVIGSTVTKVAVTLHNLSHTFPDDIDILLVGPNGTSNLIIMSDAGGDTDAAGVTLTLDDSAASPLPNSGGLASGTFRPTDHSGGDLFPPPAPAGPYNSPAPNGTATFASAFNGINPNGTWSLYVNDDAANDTGSIAGGWSIDITTELTVVGTEVIVNGTDADDTLIITATGPDSGSYTLNGGTPVPFAGITRFEFNGRGGNDLMRIINPAGGLFGPVDGIAYNGGGHPGDAMENLGGVGNLGGSYSVGATPGEGTVLHAMGTTMQRILFTGLAPVLDTVVEPSFSINATPAENAINYTQGSVAANGLVTIDNFESIEFSNKATLTINANAGSDEINLRNPNTPAGLVGDADLNPANGIQPILVNGGDPTASDTLIVNGTTGNDSINFAPTAFDAATITGAGPAISATTIEHVHINMQAGMNDLLTVTTPAGIDIAEFHSGLTEDAGRVAVRRGPGAGLGSPLLDMTFSNLVGFFFPSGLRFANTGGTRDDVLEYHGRNMSANSDSIDVSVSSGMDLIETNTPLGGFFQAPDIFTPGIRDLVLKTYGGDDLITFDDALPYESVDVDGGDGTDRINVQATPIGSINVQLIASGLSSVSGYTTNGMGFASMERLDLDAGASALSISGTSGDDDLTVSVLSATSGKIEHGAAVQKAGEVQGPIIPPLVNYSNILGALTVNLSGGDDTLIVVGNALSQTFNINASAAVFALPPLVPPFGPIPANSVQIDDGNNLTIDGTVTWLNNESLQVYGLEGNDTFNVIPGTIPVFVDGGDPIGSTAGDRIALFPLGVFTAEPGPENDEGGATGAGVQRVSWDHIEAVTIVPIVPPVGPPGFPGLFLGTNGDDDITIIARDASTHPGADGVQDFTVSLNGGPDILFLNTPVFLVDALAGDDDIVVREPAPNNAVWNVQLFIAGGTPAAPTGRPGRRAGSGDSLHADGDLYANAHGCRRAAATVGYRPYASAGGCRYSHHQRCDQSIQHRRQPIRYFHSDRGLHLCFLARRRGADCVPGSGRRRHPDDERHGRRRYLCRQSEQWRPRQPSIQPGAHVRLHGRSITTSNGGLGGYDVLQVLGTEGVDTVTSTATTISFTGAGSATIGATIDRVELFTLGSDDNVDLDLNVASLEKFVHAGAGNDIVNMLGSVDAVIFGGNGDDTLIGSPVADFIYGDDPLLNGGGNDILIGAGGNDQIFGGPGNDRFGEPALRDTTANDPGDDQFFGGEGSDIFFWDPGDGSDTIEGGAGEADILRFFGSAGAEVFNIFASPVDPSRAVLFRNLAAITINMAGVDQIDVQGNDGADDYVIGRVANGFGGVASDSGVQLQPVAPAATYPDPTAQLSDLSTTEVHVINVDLTTVVAPALTRCSSMAGRWTTTCSSAWRTPSVPA